MRSWASLEQEIGGKTSWASEGQQRVSEGLRGETAGTGGAAEAAEDAEAGLHCHIHCAYNAGADSDELSSLTLMRC